MILKSNLVILIAICYCFHAFSFGHSIHLHSNNCMGVLKMSQPFFPPPSSQKQRSPNNMSSTPNLIEFCRNACFEGSVRACQCFFNVFLMFHGGKLGSFHMSEFEKCVKSTLGAQFLFPGTVLNNTQIFVTTPANLYWAHSTPVSTAVHSVCVYTLHKVDMSHSELSESSSSL